MARQPPFPLRLIDLRPDAFAGTRRGGYLEIDREPPLRNGPNIVLIGAAAGFVAGLLLWGSLALTLFAFTDRLLGGEPDGRPLAGRTAEDGRFDCASFSAIRALSAEDEKRFQAQCGAAPVNTAAPVEAPSAPAQAPASTTNRTDCEQIRGNDYLSGEERHWFLANCVTR